MYLWWSRPHVPHSRASTSNREELKVVRKHQHTHACTNITSPKPQYQWGRYKQPILNPNVQAKSFLGNTLGSFRLKQWHYLSVTTPTHLVAVAVVQVGYVANVWCYVFNPSRTSDPLQEFRLLSPLGLGVSFASSSCEGVTEWKSGKSYIRIDSSGDAFDVSIDVVSKGTEFKGKYQITKPRKSLALLYPLEEEKKDSFPRAAYTHKVAGTPAKGYFSCAGDTVKLDGGLACMDWTRSFAKRETRWKWVNFSAYVEEGTEKHSIGLNLSSDVYEDTENTLFVDGKMYPQGAMTVTQIGPKEYSITTVQGVDITFTLIASKDENLNTLIIVDKFMQACGWYSGIIRVKKEGEVSSRMELKLHKCLGVFEDHYALW